MGEKLGEGSAYIENEKMLAQMLWASAIALMPDKLTWLCTHHSSVG